LGPKLLDPLFEDVRDFCVTIPRFQRISEDPFASGKLIDCPSAPTIGAIRRSRDRFLKQNNLGWSVHAYRHKGDELDFS
jgi:hypothetical protein